MFEVRNLAVTTLYVSRGIKSKHVRAAHLVVGPERCELILYDPLKLRAHFDRFSLHTNSRPTVISCSATPFTETFFQRFN